MSRLRTALQAALAASIVGSVGVTAAYAYWEGKRDGAKETVNNLYGLLEENNEGHREDGNDIVDLDLVLNKAFEAEGKVCSFDKSAHELIMSGKWIGEETKTLLAKCLINVASIGIRWIIADAMTEKMNKQEAKRS